MNESNHIRSSGKREYLSGKSVRNGQGLAEPARPEMFRSDGMRISDEKRKQPHPKRHRIRLVVN